MKNSNDKLQHRRNISFKVLTSSIQQCNCLGEVLHDLISRGTMLVSPAEMLMFEVNRPEGQITNKKNQELVKKPFHCPPAFTLRRKVAIASGKVFHTMFRYELVALTQTHLNTETNATKHFTQHVRHRELHKHVLADAEDQASSFIEPKCTNSYFAHFDDLKPINLQPFDSVHEATRRRWKIADYSQVEVKNTGGALSQDDLESAEQIEWFVETDCEEGCLTT